ncbi:hypothetical protein [Clostridium sp.]|uniref:hypothetical protein n=1 Tax=Clostridium sp. TaxID=1506 RepID=UPI002FCC560B
MSSFIQILFYLIVISLIVAGILSKVRTTTVKIMLFGIALIVFSNSVFKGAIEYGMDDLISIIGLSFCIVGFLKRDN